MPEQLVPFEYSLADRFSESVEGGVSQLDAFYATCADNASRHTGPGRQFLLTPTDLERYPDQSIDCQYVPSADAAIDEILQLAGVFSPGIGDEIPEFAEAHETSLIELQAALDAGYNVIEAVPTHSLAHDIALPAVKVTAALVHLFGKRVDRPDRRAHIFGKPLHWYARDGMNAPNIAAVHAGVFSVIPNSRSGGRFDKEVRQAYNKRAIAQRDLFLEQGGARLILSPGGATNTRKIRLGSVTAECQAPIKDGTADLMTSERNLVLAEACYVDPEGKVQIRLGELATLTSVEDCIALGKWAAHEYHDMSGIITWQALTAGQREAFAMTKVEDILDAARASRLGQLLARHEAGATISNESPELAE